MNKNFANGKGIFAHHVRPILADGRITIGATGAVTAVAGTLVSSVVRNSAGNYTITLIDVTQKLLSAEIIMQSPSGSDSGISKVEIANTGLVSSDAITIQCYQAQMPSVTTQGTPVEMTKVDPASGSTILFTLFLSDSSYQIPNE